MSEPQYKELRYTQYTYDEGIRLATEDLRRQLEAARGALEGYASPRTWNQWLPDSAGERARKALAAIEAGKERVK